MDRKRLSILLCASVLAVALTGCGKEAEEQADGEDVSLDLTIMHYFTPEEVENNGPVTGLHEMMEEWKAEHPNVNLVENVLTNNDYKKQAEAMAASDQLPDVFLMQGMNAKEWIREGYVLDLTEIVKTSPDYKNYKMDFFAPYEDENGNIYGIPSMTGGTCTVIVYDKALWKDAGYDSFPGAWEEVMEADAYFESQGMDTIVFANSEKWQANSSFLSTLGNLYTGKEWFDSIIAKNGAAFTDEEFVSALRCADELFQSGIFNEDFNAIGNEEMRERYMNGEAEALLGGNWDVSYVMKDLKEKQPEKYNQLGFAALPTPSDAKGDTNCQNIGMGFGFVINAKLADSPEKLEAAKSLLYKLTGADYAAYVTEHYGVSGVTMAKDTDWSKFDQITKDFYDYSYVDTNTCPIYDSYLNSQVWEILNTGLQDMSKGLKDAETVAGDTQAAYEKSYK